MKLQHLIAAVPLAAAMAAQAAPVVLDLNDGAASFSSAAASQDYEFTLPKDVVGDGSLTATFGVNSGYVISEVIFNGTTLTPDLQTSKFSNYTLFDGPLAAGTYTFTVSGMSKGGEYTGRIDVTPVPEASAMAYLAIGLAAVGLAGRRFKR
ncbi:MAG: FxDxF family PEP-CTERM protein [Aquabacterium sp.]